MNRKPRILLIPNLAWWVIGEMGKQIIARFGDKYDFYFVPERVLERRPDTNKEPHRWHSPAPCGRVRCIRAG
jgi:hypothetical protein